MGSKPNWNQLFAQLQASIDRASAPSPYETAMAQDWTNTRNWLNAKDYRNTPAGVNVDLLPIAEYQKMRQMTRGQNNNGTAAAGVQNNALMSQQRELDDNQFTQDWGNAYENQVGNLMNQNSQLGAGLQGAYTNRMNAGVQGAMGSLQALNSKPKGFWSSFLPSLAGAAASFI